PGEGGPAGARVPQPSLRPALRPRPRGQPARGRGRGALVSAVALRASVREELGRHGLEAGPDETAAALRERLNALYVSEVRQLRERQVRGEIPRREYAAHVAALRD